MVNYVKVGRLARVLRGPREGRVGVITAIIDSNRVLLENPLDEKMWRHVQSLQNIEPTKFVVKVGVNASTKSVKAALEEKNTLAKYATTGKAKAVAAKKALAESTDFERYQLRVAKRSRAHWSRKIFAAADAKTPTSWHAKKAAKLEKVNKKFEGKHKRSDKVQKAVAAKKAKNASKKTAKK
jgi:large subunit ribosomal protein L14e